MTVGAGTSGPTFDQVGSCSIAQAGWSQTSMPINTPESGALF